MHQEDVESWKRLARLPFGTLVDAARQQAAALGSHPFLLCDGSRIGYSEFATLMHEGADRLAGEGVVRGDRVALMLDNCVEYVVLWFAVNALGATVVPVNVNLHGTFLEHILRTAECKLVVAEAEYATHLERLGVPWAERLRQRTGTGLFSWARSGRVQHPATELGPWDPATIYFTSGTTGRSKGAVAPHAYHLVNAASNARCRRITSRDVLYTCLPLYHANAQVWSLVAGLVTGSTVAIDQTFSASRFWERLIELGATQFNFVGSILPALLNQEPKPQDRAHGARVAWGAPAGKAIYQAFRDRFRVTLLQTYGLSEAGVLFDSDLEEHKPGASGRIVEHVEVSLRNEHDLEADPLAGGEICARPRVPWTLMTEYVGMPEATVQAFRNQWLHTGDLGRMDEDGYFHFVDRDKDCIRRRGRNISSFEVEDAVQRVPGIREVAAYPVSSALGEDDVMLALVLGEGVQLKELVARIDEELPRFMQPTYIRVMAALPKTEATHRTKKKDLREAGTAVADWVRGGRG